jgi:hypothetical protein
VCTRTSVCTLAVHLTHAHIRLLATPLTVIRTSARHPPLPQALESYLSVSMPPRRKSKQTSRRDPSPYGASSTAPASSPTVRSLDLGSGTEDERPRKKRKDVKTIFEERYDVKNNTPEQVLSKSASACSSHCRANLYIRIAAENLDFGRVRPLCLAAQHCQSPRRFN